MNWFKKLFRKKSQKTNINQNNDDRIIYGHRHNYQNDDDLLSPSNILNPLSPISIWNNGDSNPINDSSSSYDCDSGSSDCGCGCDCDCD